MSDEYVLRLTEDEYSIIRSSLGMKNKAYKTAAIKTLCDKVTAAGYKPEKPPKNNAIWDAVKSYGRGAGS